MQKHRKILVAPMNWGLGHATRCIPVVKQVLCRGDEVVLASDGRALDFLKKCFPQLEFIRLPSYHITYPVDGNMIRHFTRLIPKIFKTITEEHLLLKKIISSHQIDAVISDNRFGMWTRKIPCAFITHQLKIKSPVLPGVVNGINKQFINKFNYCWVPDVEDANNLSGELSHGNMLINNVRFIGPLSRFGTREKRNEVKTKYDVLAIISGPEPQRSIFERIILRQFARSNLRTIMLTGCPKEETHCQLKNIEIHSHLPDDKFLQILNQSDVIISRSGYSGIMDMAALGKKAILIPTPGQPEQIYLAHYHAQAGHYYSEAQEKFDLLKVLGRLSNFHGLRLTGQPEIIAKALDDLLN